LGCRQAAQTGPRPFRLGTPLARPTHSRRFLGRYRRSRRESTAATGWSLEGPPGLTACSDLKTPAGRVAFFGRRALFSGGWARASSDERLGGAVPSPPPPPPSKGWNQEPGGPTRLAGSTFNKLIAITGAHAAGMLLGSDRRSANSNTIQKLSGAPNNTVNNSGRRPRSVGAGRESAP